MSNPDGPKDSSPFVKCTKHGTCRLDCRESCNTRILVNPTKETPTSMNTKDRRDYQRNQRAARAALGKARNALAEMDAISFRSGMLHNHVRDLRELLGVAYSMALDTRLDLWPVDVTPTPETIRLQCKSLLVLAQARGRDGDRTVQEDIEGAVALIQQLAKQKIGAVKPSDHPAGRGTGGLAAQPATGRTGVGARRTS